MKLVLESCLTVAPAGGVWEMTVLVLSFGPGVVQYWGAPAGVWDAGRRTSRTCRQVSGTQHAVSTFGRTVALRSPVLPSLREGTSAATCNLNQTLGGGL